jgi:hypothetical protein
MHSERERPSGGRKGERRTLTSNALVRRARGAGFRVTLFDLSCDGCKIEFVERASAGERVWVKLDGIEAIEGTVRWIDGPIGGVEFNHPLHIAIFEHLVARSNR